MLRPCFTDEGELAEVNSLVKKIFDILNRETSRVRKEKEAFDDVAKKLEHVHFSKTLCISQFHLRPAPPPGLLRGICPPCQSRGWGICNFCTARGPGICQPPGHSRAFDTHAVSYQNITTQKVLLEKKQIGSSIKDRKKL